MASVPPIQGSDGLPHSGQPERKPEAMDDRLKQLLDYTKFHIGLYTALATLLITALSTKDKSALATHYRGWLLCVFLLLALAGMFGGLVGSSIPRYRDFDEFERTRLGPWENGWLVAADCMHLEHLAFWLAVVVAMTGIIVNSFGLYGMRCVFTFGIPSVVVASGVMLSFTGARRQTRFKDLQAAPPAP